MGDDGALYDKSRLDDGSGASSNDPNIQKDLRNRMDATMLANIPNSKANASTPMMDPRTNHKYMDDRYTLAL